MLLLICHFDRKVRNSTSANYTITTGIPAQYISYQPCDFFLSIPTYLVLPRPKCPSMFDAFALYNINHGKNRFFSRYLSAVNFPGNLDVAHVSVACHLAYICVWTAGEYLRQHLSRMQGYYNRFAFFAFQFLGHVLFIY